MLGANEGRQLLERLLPKVELRSARVLAPEDLQAAWATKRHLVAAMQGLLHVEGRDVTLRIGLGPRFPHTLPQIFLAPPDQLGDVPHVEADGRICYRADEGLLLDSEQPLKILEEALEAATSTLIDGASGVNWLDFADELEAYWLQIAKHSPIPCYVTPDDALRRIWLSRQGRACLYVADSIEQVRAFENGRAIKQTQEWCALYVPLLPTTLSDRFTPGQFKSPNWTREFVLKHLSKENRALLEHLGTKEKHRSFIVLSVPRPKGGKGLVALEYLDLSGGHPFVGGTSSRPVHHIALERRDREYVMARGGGALSLTNKHVVLAGCGAVGGYLAHALAWTGLGHLTLVDFDSYGAQNTFRSVLGKSAVGVRKVDALKRELTTKIPYLAVHTVRNYVESAVEKGELDLDKTDLIVFAIGDATASLQLNKVIHDRSSGPAMVFTWVEPYGIGGHALFTNSRVTGVRGCFRCLLPPPKPDEERQNRADFAGPGQTFTKDLSGCASIYTPYADLDARRTADLAARLILDFLHGRKIGHPLLSWKGDTSAFLAAGFKLSARYELSEDQLREYRFTYVREDCDVCGDRP
ncbi:E2/UBC family protein [Sorangium sp. So ce590]|uniref:ThiF family adenylyltransferase n=1 Tax=Sorangium sp. So ce590 TaxID=3133317 RepID=UPI003F5E0579